MTGDTASLKRIVIGIFAGFAILGAAACTSGARGTAAVAPVSESTILPFDSPLRKAVTVGSVVGEEGGGETGLVISSISNEDFREALTTSLDLNQILGEGDTAPMSLDATIEKVDQPQLAINLTDNMTVFYRLIEKSTGRIVWEERVFKGDTTRFTESLIRSERQRIANENGARANIERFLERLVKASKDDPDQFFSDL
ncbi:MAG: hypothetical protein AAGF51_06435 [Pseudomonadota bacterium]